jgi:hypothetical protein|tara:strand:- start:5543 stop:5692 length:150 start_codon:yes stop_codon:yes gene_type:complete
MSMAICEHCDRVFNAKDDPDSMEQPDYNFICEPCREWDLEQRVIVLEQK